ncbi:MAG TPA: RagB/SusD family nutrient uptake outer membrane protein [Sphingobacteriaceae bacterium]
MKLTYHNMGLKLLVIAFFTCAFLNACELDKYPEVAISEEGYWKTPEDFRDAANYFYSYLPGMSDNYAANWSDDAYAVSPNSISDGSRTTPATTADWDNNYRLIRASNTLLEKSRVTSADRASIKRYLGEAYFFRAFANFELVKRYGDVPLILKTFDVNDPETQAPRTSKEIVLDAIYTDLDSAVTHLLTADQLASTEYGRITKGAALALKARIGLFSGTRNKFHGQGDHTKHLNIALAASEALMNSNHYGLFTYAGKPDSSYYYLFQKQGEGRANRENILVRLYGESITNNQGQHSFSAELTNGFTTPTRSLMDAYLYKDGLPKEQSTLYKTPVNTLTEFEDRDMRIGATVFNKTHFFTTSLYSPTFSFSNTGYKTRKYFDATSANNKAGFTDYIFLRYAEILLTYAEAKFELNGSITDGELNRSINLIRARAKMPELTNAFVQTNQLDMRNEIRRERRIEMAFEGQTRYWDLIRWKIAETELPKSILGAKFFPTEYGTSIIPSTNAEGIVIVQDASRRKFDKTRDYLWPLPTRDLSLDLNLTQNPGW